MSQPFKEPHTKRNAPPWYDVIVAGGGLAGLITAIELSRAGHRVLVLEKKSYPFHKVCGEYVSHEVLHYLKSLGFDPYEHGAVRLTKLHISTPAGREFHAPLQMGGFGLSRYVMDDALQQLAAFYGARIMCNARVTDLRCEHGIFEVVTADGERFNSLLAIGSWGKRDVLDKKLDRQFLKSHTGYMAVKQHIRSDYAADTIGLHNFPGGYCGISRIEGDDCYNLCYLYQRSYGNFKTVQELEQTMLHTNPVLKRILQTGEPLLSQPEVINEISFAPKGQVAGHVLMCGDTAGLITPLCGNGMSMAIAGARLLSSIILESQVLRGVHLPVAGRAVLEKHYSNAWQRAFGRRLFWGRTLQKFFGAPRLSELVLRSIHALPAAERWLIRQTHGTPLDAAPATLNKYLKQFGATPARQN